MNAKNIVTRRGKLSRLESCHALVENNWHMIVLCFLLVAYPQLASCQIPHSKTECSIQTGVNRMVNAASDPQYTGSPLEELACIGSPPHEIVGALAHAINHDPRFQDQCIRRFAFEALGLFHSTDKTLAFHELVTCIYNETRTIQTICLGSATNALSEDPLVALPILKKFWLAVDIEQLGLLEGDSRLGVNARFVRELIRATAKLGFHAKSFAGDLERITRSESVDPRLRADAVYTLVNIVGVEDVLGRLAEVGAGTERALLAALGRVIVARDLREDIRKRVDDRLLMGLEHADPRVREAALRTLGGTIGSRFLVQRGPNDFELDARLAKALTDVAASDPNPRVRSRAAHMLSREFLLQRAKAIGSGERGDNSQ